MARPPELSALPQRAPTERQTKTTSPGAEGLPSPFRNRRWSMAFLGWLFLHLCHPAAWHPPRTELWVPATGLGMFLLAWLGPRALALIAVASLTSSVQASLWGNGLP